MALFLVYDQEEHHLVMVSAVYGVYGARKTGIIGEQTALESTQYICRLTVLLGG